MLFKQQKSLTPTMQMALLALFIALRAMAGMFRIPLGDHLVLSFSFLFIMIEVIIFDWKLVIISAALGDVLNALLFPNGAFMIQYTIFAIFQTLVYWIGLHGKRITLVRLTIIKLINNVVCNIIGNSLLTHFLFYVPLQAAILTRLPKNLIMWPIETAVAFIVLKFIRKLLIQRNIVDAELLPLSMK